MCDCVINCVTFGLPSQAQEASGDVPEYRSLACLPADQFIPALMKRFDFAYYVGLLSAAQLRGAAHQRPQESQVPLAKNRRPNRLRGARSRRNKGWKLYLNA
jgi:hypothetical protein